MCRLDRGQRVATAELEVAIRPIQSTRPATTSFADRHTPRAGAPNMRLRSNSVAIGIRSNALHPRSSPSGAVGAAAPGGGGAGGGGRGGAPPWPEPEAVARSSKKATASQLGALSDRHDASGRPHVADPDTPRR
jgi:hypothetical protein